MTSLHPLTRVQMQIKSENVRAAFDRAIGDKKTPNELDRSELGGFFAAATHNDPGVRGHDLTAAELADLQMIQKEGGKLLMPEASVRASYARRLSTYEAKPQATIMDTDPGIAVKSLAMNKVAIQGRANGDLCPSGVVCVIGGPTTVSMEVGGQRFAVQPHHNERASSVAKRLAAELAEGGYRTSLYTSGGRTVLTIVSKSEVEPRPAYEPGTYAALKGTLLENNADDGSKTLKLDRKIQVGDKLTDEIKVRGAYDLPAGAAELNGRLDVVQLPHEIFPPMFEVQLSGVSNLAAGEPKFDGQKFTNSLGKTLETLHYNRPLIMDAPAVLFVLDQSHDKAFVGAMGGFIPPDMNPFHGFNSVRSIREPTRRDIGEVQFRLVSDTPGGRAREEWPHSRASGEPLEQISEEIGVAGKRWFIDHDTMKVYGFEIFGPTERAMTHVVAKDPRDV